MYFWKPLYFSGSWIGTFLRPKAMIALRFLEPITAPVPARPATRSWLTMAAKRTLFSPAGPMTALPYFFGNASWVSSVPLPQR